MERVAARHGQVAARGRVAGEAVLDAARPGTAAGPAGARHELARLQEQAHPGHGAGRGRRLRLLRACRPTRSSTSSCSTTRGMMVQSMRSGTIVQPGETTGCVGCHEDRRTARPPATGCPSAMRRAAAAAGALVRPAAEVQLPGRGPAGLRQALRRVPRLRQGGGQEAQPGRRPGPVFNTSYVELRRKGYVPRGRRRAARGPAAEAWGSHASRLVEVAPGRPRQAGDRPPGAARPRGASTGSSPGSTSTPRTIPSIDGLPGQPLGRAPLDQAQLHRLGQLTA